MTRLYRFLILLTTISWLGVLTVAVSAQDTTRSTYSWTQPAKTVTFNAITNNPSFGDERNFLRVRPFESNTYTDSLRVADGQEVVIMAYYDNDAASNYNLKAKNTQLKITIPLRSDKLISVSSSLMADNAKPTIVTDSTNLNADSAFSLKYEAGSAQIWNNYLRGQKLPDSVTSIGTQIGTTTMNGTIPGGAASSGYVTIKAKVQYAKTNASTGSVGVIGGVPNTGPGDVAALFAGATAFGAIAHRLNAARRRP